MAPVAPASRTRMVKLLSSGVAGSRRPPRLPQLGGRSTACLGARVEALGVVSPPCWLLGLPLSPSEAQQDNICDDEDGEGQGKRVTAGGVQSCRGRAEDQQLHPPAGQRDRQRGAGRRKQSPQDRRQERGADPQRGLGGRPAGRPQAPVAQRGQGAQLQQKRDHEDCPVECLADHRFSAAVLSAVSHCSMPVRSLALLYNNTSSGPAIDSSERMRVAASSVASSTCRSTALAPVEIPVQVSSRPGSTTANLDLMRALPLTQVNRASAATVESRWTSWTARSQVPQAGTLTSSSQTLPTGASMRISRAAPTGALASMRPFFAYSSCNTSIEGPL